MSLSKRASGHDLRRSISGLANRYADSAGEVISGETLELNRAYFWSQTNTWKIVLPIFLEDNTRARAFAWLFTYMFLSLSQIIIDVYVTNTSIQMKTALERMDGQSFYSFLVVWLLGNLASLIRKGLVGQALWELRMMIQWRITFYMSHGLFSADTFYKLNLGKAKLMAPEGLICHEAFMWLVLFTTFVDMWVGNIIAVCTTLILLTSWSIPWTLYLLFTLPLRAGLSTLTFPPPLRKMHSHNIAINWDLQFLAARIADSAEQIALFRGCMAEARRLCGLIKLQCKAELWIQFYQRFYSASAQITSTLFMLPVYYVLFEEVMENKISVSAAMTYSMQAFSIQFLLQFLQGCFGQMSRLELTAGQMLMLMTAGAHCVAEEKNLKRLATKKKRSNMFILIEEYGDQKPALEPELELRDVSLCTPGMDRRTILADFCLKLNKGESVLIVGETGVGKSVLLRSIHGLWICGSGNVSRCQRDDLSCVPQRPFMFYGTLRENLLYPELEDGVTDDQLIQAMTDVNLAAVLEINGLDTFSKPWQDVLSLGQQQRLGIARLLLRKKIRLLLLDEATSAMDIDNERRIYELVKSTFPCYISVAHRPSVRKYHTHVTHMTLNDKDTTSLAVAKFMPLADFEAQDLDLSHIEKKESLVGNAEERVLQQKRQDLYKNLIQNSSSTPASKEATQASTTTKRSKDELKVQLRLPNMERKWGGFGLMKRCVCEVLYPMLSEKEVRTRIALFFAVGYGINFLSLGLEKLFGYPYSQTIGILQQRDRTLAWSFYLNVILWYYPVAQIVEVAASWFKMSLIAVVRAVVKLDLTSRYLDQRTDSYFHINQGRLLKGNPGNRISTYDSDTSAMFLSGLVNTLSSTVFAFYMSGSEVLNMGYTMFAFYGVFILGGCLFYHSLGGQVFAGYQTWLELTMQLHSRIVQVRENSEAVAMLRGCDSERTRAFEHLDSAIQPGSKFVWLSEWLKFAGNFYFSKIPEIALMILTGPMVLQGQLPFAAQDMMLGSITMGATQSKMLCDELLGNAEGQVSVERLWELAALTAAIRDGNCDKKRWGGDIVLEEEEHMDCALALEDVTLETPASFMGKTLRIVTKLSFKFYSGESMIIAGESGMGKSSILRVIAGVWRNGTGTIRVRNHSKTLFIPQRPYLFAGTLREQLLYPLIERTDVSDEKLYEICEAVGLAHLARIHGLGEHRNVIEQSTDVESEPDRFWAFQLSLGEIQRLAFGRMLLKDEVQMVFLDEATAALSTEGEKEMYGLVASHAPCYISVAHRPQLRRYHKKALTMLRKDADSPTVCKILTMSEYEKALGEGTLAADSADTTSGDTTSAPLLTDEGIRKRTTGVPQP